MTRLFALRYPRKNAPVRPKTFVLHAALDAAATDCSSHVGWDQSGCVFSSIADRSLATRLRPELPRIERCGRSRRLRVAVPNRNGPAHRTVAFAREHADSVSA